MLRAVLKGDHDAGTAPVVEEPLAMSASAELLSRVALRKLLHLNNVKLGQALLSLEHDGVLVRTDSGWTIRAATAAAATAPVAAPATPATGQLDLVLPTAPIQ